MVSESQVQSNIPPSSADSEFHKPLFHRPNKKRKIYRRPHSDEDETSSPPLEPQPQSLDELIASSSVAVSAATGPFTGNDAPDEDGSGGQISMADLFRLRKLRKQRVGGVEFKADGAGRHTAAEDYGKHGDTNGAETQSEEAVSSVAAVRRFAPQTGTVGDVNKHMMAYIDSELAKRRSQALVANTTESVAAQASPPLTTRSKEEAQIQYGIATAKGPSMDPKKTEADVAAERQPTALGKLLEVDLGEESRTRNVELTDQARRRLGGEDAEADSGSGSGGAQKKVRLGRDGKPWRGRKRRGSDDIKRDRLVEEVLRENRLEIYETPLPTSNTVSDDQAADDRIAEEFKREFLDAMSARQRKKIPPAQTSGRGKKEEEALKGPKLGGSRSARAAMRDQMLKNAKK